MDSFCSVATVQYPGKRVNEEDPKITWGLSVELTANLTKYSIIVHFEWGEMFVIFIIILNCSICTTPLLLYHQFAACIGYRSLEPNLRYAKIPPVPMIGKRYRRKGRWKCRMWHYEYGGRKHNTAVRTLNELSHTRCAKPGWIGVEYSTWSETESGSLMQTHP